MVKQKNWKCVAVASLQDNVKIMEIGEEQIDSSSNLNDNQNLEKLSNSKINGFLKTVLNLVF